MVAGGNLGAIGGENGVAFGRRADGDAAGEGFDGIGRIEPNAIAPSLSVCHQFRLTRGGLLVQLLCRFQPRARCRGFLAEVLADVRDLFCQFGEIEHGTGVNCKVAGRRILLA